MIRLAQMAGYAGCARVAPAAREVDEVLPRHDGRDQHRDRRNGAEVGMITTEGFRDILHIARHKKPLNFSLPGPAVAELSAGRAPLPADRARAYVPDGEVLVPLDEDGRASRSRAYGGGRRGGRGLLPVLVPQPRARAARRGDRARGVPRGVPLGLARGPAAVPRVRALLDVCAERLHRPEGGHYLRSRRAMRFAGCARDVHLMQLRGAGDRRRPPSAAGEPADVGAGRRRRRRHLGRRAVGLRQRDHARRRRHLGRHRRRPGGQLRMKHLLDTKVGGYQAMIPMVDVDTIGAGGGSIAYVDEGGMFRVGPRSAAPCRGRRATAAAAPSRRRPTRSSSSAGCALSAASSAAE